MYVIIFKLRFQFIEIQLFVEQKILMVTIKKGRNSLFVIT